MAHWKRLLFLPLVPLCLPAADPVPDPPPDPAPCTVLVTGPDGAPVPEATVWLLGGKGGPIHATLLTDAKGEARLRPPRAGDYTVRVGKGGFRLTETPLKAGGQEGPPVQVRLERSA